jgi:phosphoglycolate phosphatase
VEFDAVIFDLDGTLADTLADIAAAMNRVLAAHDLPEHEPAAYKLMIGCGLGNLVREALPPERRDDETVAACHAEMMADYGRHCLDATRLYEGVPELLAHLADEEIALAVLSNKADELTQRIVAALFAPDTFAEVVGRRPDLPAKPDPAAALLIAERLAAAPERVAYLGDSGVDMRTATAAGMIAIGVTWGFRDRAELEAGGARLTLDHPLELVGPRR